LSLSIVAEFSTSYEIPFSNCCGGRRSAKPTLSPTQQPTTPTESPTMNLTVVPSSSKMPTLLSRPLTSRTPSYPRTYSPTIISQPPVWSQVPMEINPLPTSTHICSWSRARTTFHSHYEMIRFNCAYYDIAIVGIRYTLIVFMSWLKQFEPLYCKQELQLEIFYILLLLHYQHQR
jgi:hypothetical protein